MRILAAAVFATALIGAASANAQLVNVARTPGNVDNAIVTNQNSTVNAMADQHSVTDELSDTTAPDSVRSHGAPEGRN